jgi:hypothetical protein
MSFLKSIHAEERETMMKSNESIGYFGCFEVSGRFMGALMVTDSKGIPQEFKYTEPIKPTKIQGILYGGSLESYIKRDVIRGKLFKAINNKPKYILIDNSDSTLLGTADGLTTVMIQRARVAGLKEVGDSQQPHENELLLMDHDNREPLRVISHPEDAAQIGELKELIMTLAYAYDVVEPLTRLESAINALLKQNTKA